MVSLWPAAAVVCCPDACERSQSLFNLLVPAGACAECPVTGAALAPSVCKPTGHMLRLNDATTLYLPSGSVSPSTGYAEQTNGSPTLTALRRVKVELARLQCGRRLPSLLIAGVPEPDT